MAIPRRGSEDVAVERFQSRLKEREEARGDENEEEVDLDALLDAPSEADPEEAEFKVGDDFPDPLGREPVGKRAQAKKERGKLLEALEKEREERGKLQQQVAHLQGLAAAMPNPQAMMETLARAGQPREPAGEDPIDAEIERSYEQSSTTRLGLLRGSWLRKTREGTSSKSATSTSEEQSFSSRSTLRNQGRFHPRRLRRRLRPRRSTLGIRISCRIRASTRG
jgi:hypothetical protein